MRIRSLIASLSRWLGGFLFGARITHDEGHGPQFDTIAIAYVLNAFVASAFLILILVVWGLLQSSFAALRSNLGEIVAASNLLSFALTYLSSLSWTANQKYVDALRNRVEARGRDHLANRVVAPVLIFIWGLVALVLMVSLFYTLARHSFDSVSFGNLLASVAANVLLLQAMFVRRSVGNIHGRSS